MQYAGSVSLTLSVLPGRFAVCRLDPQAPIPAWAERGEFFSITSTADELSIVCAEEHAPAGATCERGWRAIKIEGPFDFDAIGILASACAPLAEAEVSILAIATYDTDYVLVKEGQLETAVTALLEKGHRVQGRGTGGGGNESASARTG